MSAVFNGMAVLLIRLLFLLISYYLMSKIDWRKILHPRYANLDVYLALMASFALAYLASSFFITIIEILQSILLALFL
ncbi:MULTISPECIES: DUF1146 family protein [Facklamia]|uniref:DUF1146 family protein n=1 Tax=Facklamia hominis TaxID=178214 RepID=A0AAJ1Q4R9_9LACT|nr:MULTISPECIES: DUF1146 family protein [Facklamia]EPH13308.1 hypothetical protein HMPREF9260_00080 [Facklamia hominis ACS-120-V-Sch10]MDK7186774.1 DUF1146 family protein [Facklamia hominis]OFL66553.1 hypothetical protein HMPREF2758_07405 [Facklamia sp. HMSC062C11]